MITPQYFKIDVYSHHFTLTQVQPRGRVVAESFAKSYMQYGLKKEGRRFVRAPIRVFAVRVREGIEFRFHIRQYEEFMRHLSNLQVLPHSYELTTHVPEPGLKVGLKLLPNWEPRDVQIPVIDYIASPEPSKVKLVEIQTGAGKGQILSAKVKVPGGWKQMGEIQVGDSITAWDGTPTKVLGVYPQGEKQTYRVTFSDGRSTVVDDTHLWKVYYINTEPHKRWRVVDTVEMLRLISMPNPRVYVPLCESEIGTDVELPVDPYILGCILGDGCLRATGVTISKDDPALFENIAARLPEGIQMVPTSESCMTYGLRKTEGSRNPMIAALRQMDLMGKLSYDKFIPDVYFNASKSQRLELLRGLMDTDGTADHHSSVSFASTSKALATGVQYLVRSLGGIAKITSRQTHYTYNGVRKMGVVCYTVFIRIKTPSELFLLPRKKERTNDENQYADGLKLRVVSVVPEGIQPTQCISIEHPDHLYITDDFIVTHNTFCAAAGAEKIDTRMVIIVRPMYIEKWKSDIEELYGFTGSDVVVVQGSAQLMHLITNAVEGRLKAKVIIISNKTLQNWYSLYEKKGNYVLDQGYDCLPGELMPILHAGIRLIDEVHQDFHLNFKIDLYTHVERSISLSATLKGDDPFVNRMYELAYPRDIRFAGMAYNRYVDAFSWIFQVDQPDKVRTTEWGSTTYSHHAFEKSMMRDKNLLEDYLAMIEACCMRIHFEHYQKGDRLLVYCASIQMCTLVAEHLKTVMGGIDVRRYVEDDPYENLMTADVSVSTIQSAGTGHDIAGLTSVILTTAISSSQSNIQGFGRLRKIPNRKLRFAYFVCSSIPKHLEYHMRKKDMLARMAQSYDTIAYPHHLGR